MAIVAAEIGAERGLATAAAFIYATARLEGCELVTLDADFRGLPGVHAHRGRRVNPPTRRFAPTLGFPFERVCL